MERNRKLMTGSTVIGTIKGKFRDRFEQFTIYYGNAASPLVDGKMLVLPEERYLNILNQFLDSDEGQEYIIPTREEIEQAHNEMLNREQKMKENARSTEPVPEVIQHVPEHIEQVKEVPESAGLPAATRQNEPAEDKDRIEDYERRAAKDAIRVQQMREQEHRDAIEKVRKKYARAEKDSRGIFLMLLAVYSAVVTAILIAVLLGYISPEMAKVGCSIG